MSLSGICVPVLEELFVGIVISPIDVTGCVVVFPLDVTGTCNGMFTVAVVALLLVTTRSTCVEVVGTVILPLIDPV